MADHPILFSGPMVRPILDGTKTQTRRVVRTRLENNTRVGPCAHQAHIASPEALDHCPYGVPGDRLWVREKWALIPKERPAGYFVPGSRYFNRHAWYWADNDKPTWGGNWKPSIHMPKKFCRLWLEVTDVRVQRVQEISEEDAITEGVRVTEAHRMNAQLFAECRPDLPPIAPAQQAFCELWDSINAKRGYPRDSNPWVWAISFKRIANTESSQISTKSSRPGGEAILEIFKDGIDPGKEPKHGKPSNTDDRSAV